MIEVKNLVKAYRPKKGEAVQALKGVSLKFEDKGLVFILGKSGSGKSTLLNMLGGLDQFDDGEIIVKGKSSKEFAQADFDSYRNTFIGFIFQEYNILNDFTVGANIALAMELQGKKPTKETLNKILKEVDLEGFADRKPNELSGGQKQRVAIARALIKNPEIIMADEPTGALDSNTGKQVFDTLKRLSKDKLVIVVSHDREFAEQYGDRVIEMKDGEVISDIKKYVAKSANINEGIQIVNEKIIHIKSGYELTAQDLSMINEYLKKNQENDSYISLDHRTNDKIRQAAQIDENGNQQAFETTSEDNLQMQQYDGSKLKLIAAKLPLKSSLKMAAGSLKKKPFRLAMTVLLSTVSFSLFGLVNTMSSYDKIKAGTDSIIDSKIDYIALTKEKEVNQGAWSYYISDKMNDTDLAAIEARFPQNAFTPVVNLNGASIAYESNIKDLSKLNPYGSFAYYPSAFQGAATITMDQIEALGYTLTGNLPAARNEVVITKAVAESFVQGGYLAPKKDTKGKKISSVDEMIGKSLSLYLGSEDAYTITGILDTKFDGSRYEMFQKEMDPTASGLSVYMLQSEMSTVMAQSYHTLLITNETLWNEIYDSNIGLTTFGSTYDLMLTEGETQYSFDSAVEFSELEDGASDQIVFFDAAQTALSDGEILLSVSMLEQNPKLYRTVMDAVTDEELRSALIANADEFDNLDMKVSVFQLTNDWMPVETDVKVAGIYLDTTGIHSGITVFADGFFEQNELQVAGKYTAILGKMPESRMAIQDVVAYSYDNGIEGIHYTLRNATSGMLDNVNSLVEGLRNVLFGVGVGFAIFAGLMLMNFITTSISYRKREIGILRAVGARGRDVFAIFFQESAIIALINWCLALAATGFVVSMLNQMFRRNYNFVITVFHFGWIQVVLMLGLSLFVAFAASFFPVYRVSKKKPIEVIRKN